MHTSEVPASRFVAHRSLPQLLIAIGLLGLGIAALAVVPSLLKIFASVASTNWQTGLVFILVGLMLAVLLGYPYLSIRYQSSRQPLQRIDQMITVSSTAVLLLGISIMACILVIPPIS